MDVVLRHCPGDRDQGHPQEKEMQKGKMAEEASQIAVKREVKSKGEKERYTYQNADSIYCKEYQGEIRKPS